MATDIYVILGHRLSDVQMEELPDALNEYSRGDTGLFRLRFSHCLSGQIQEQDGKWVWKPYSYVDPAWAWAVDEGVLVSEEHWAWAWNTERDGSFRQWFAENIKYGRLRLNSTLSSLDIGLHSAVLAPPIRWRNFLDPVVQIDLRRYARFLTGFFGGSSVIYVPDDIDPGCEAASKVSDGWSFDQITKWLHSQTPPATSIEDMFEPVNSRGVKGFYPRGFYLDDFLDLNMG